MDSPLKPYIAKTYNNKCKDNIYFLKKNIQYKNCERLCVIINNIINKKIKKHNFCHSFYHKLFKCLTINDKFI